MASSLTTGNNSIDSLVYSSWARNASTPVSLSYSFMTRLPSDATPDDTFGFKVMTAAQQAGVRTALAAWSAVANITFTEVASNGNIQMGSNDQGKQSSGYAYLPDGHSATYLFVNNTDSHNSVFTAGTYGPAVLIHELGHTLGLKHPGDYDSTGSTISGPFLPSATDNLDYTEMSYNVGSGFSLNGNYGITPMLYDIQAMQYLYGANMTYHTGDDAYAFVKGSALQCIWDAGGTDTFDFSACTTATVINLNAGTFSSTAPGYNNISIAYNVTIERAVAGSGGSTITANDAGDLITGGAGADKIYVGAGNDTIIGGAGSDTVVFKGAFASYSYTIDLSGSTITFNGEGSDALSGVENLQFSDRTVAVSTLARVTVGSDGADRLQAGVGTDTIDGKGGLDSVSYSGNLANYQVSLSGNVATVKDVASNGGTDTLTSVERLVFADGKALALDVAANAIGGEAFRLYQAAFNRAPDLSGLGFWIAALDQGVTLHSVAQSFVDSSEFKTLYGAAPSDADFVKLLYNNVLHRAPDQAGSDFWVQGLHNGATRADILINFSESPENQAGVAPLIGNGFTYLVFG
jgi:hypothetical protein